MELEPIVSWAMGKTSGKGKEAEIFLGDGNSWPRYAIGKNEETLAVHRLAPLHGIIDDFSEEGSHWQNIPLFRSNAVPKCSKVVNCSTSIRPVDTHKHLVNAGFRNVVSYFDLLTVTKGALPLQGFVAAQRLEITTHLATWQTIHDSLEDESSRKTLRDLLSFRLSADLDQMCDYTVRLDQQYFEDFMQYRSEVFVDAGAFDGDTAEAFARRYPDYRKILLFEPSEKNLSAARNRLTGYRDMHYFQTGLSDSPGQIRFDDSRGSASSICSDGGEEIQVDRLDALVEEPVSFIKMDLEGWELPAIAGASRHILEDQPKLAIAVYHNASDLRRIHALVQTFGHTYRMFLRHYTQGWSETILFFRP